MQRPHRAIPLVALRFACIVRDGRALLDLSQAELARRAGISREALCRLEGGHGGTPTRTLEAVLAALDAGGVALDHSGRPDLADAPRWTAAR
jgi:transcriptional regulator with XRE-family HTH domain